ncbi:MAG: IMPACT family protein, partial [Flavobacteriales bacterium]
GQLRAFDLTQTLVVVVRYFGGTKLGVGGLIQAYKESSKLALSEAQIIEKTITLPFSLHFGYPELNTVMRLIKDLPLENQNREFMEDCKLHFSIRKGEISTLEQRFTDIKNITLINPRKEKT